MTLKCVSAAEGQDVMILNYEYESQFIVAQAFTTSLRPRPHIIPIHP
jgi:hypothetical protein